MDSLTNILFQYYQKTVPKTPVQPTLNEGLGLSTPYVKTVPVPGTQVDLSALGRQFNEFSKTLTGDATAKNGLRGFIMEANKPGDLGKAATIVTSLRQLQTADKATFQKAFETAGGMEKSGLKVTPFLSGVGKLTGTTSQKDFVQAANEITGAKEPLSEKNTTLQSLYTTVSDIMKDYTGAKQKGLLSDLFTGLESKNTLTEKNSFLREFQQNQLGLTATA